MCVWAGAPLLHSRRLPPAARDVFPETAYAFSSLNKTLNEDRYSIVRHEPFPRDWNGRALPIVCDSPYALRLEPHHVALALAPLATMLLTWPFVFVRLERVYGCVVTCESV